MPELLIVLLTLMITVGGTVAVGRHLKARRLQPHDVAMWVIGPSLGALYLLFVAFALSVVWQSSRDAESAARGEARAAVEVYWASRGLPEPTATDLRADLRAYTMLAVGDDWRAMRAGKLDDTSDLRLDSARLRLLDIPVTTPDGAAARDTALTAVRELSSQRAKRADLMRAHLPFLLRLVGVICCGIMVTFPIVMGLGTSTTSRLAAIAQVSVVVLATLILVQVGHPYSGPVGVDPTAIRADFKKFDQIDSYLPAN